MTGNQGIDLRWLTKSSQIRSAKKEGVLLRGEHLLSWVSTERAVEIGPPAVGIVIRRGFKRAVDRNLMRRRLRGCIFDLRQTLKPGHVYLIECKPGAERIDYQILVKEIEGLLTRVGS
jgi:ribonuclease P protein component